MHKGEEEEAKEKSKNVKQKVKEKCIIVKKTKIDIYTYYII